MWILRTRITKTHFSLRNIDAYIYISSYYLILNSQYNMEGLCIHLRNWHICTDKCKEKMVGRIFNPSHVVLMFIFYHRYANATRISRRKHDQYKTWSHQQQQQQQIIPTYPKTPNRIVVWIHNLNINISICMLELHVYVLCITTFQFELAWFSRFG